MPRTARVPAPVLQLVAQAARSRGIAGDAAVARAAGWTASRLSAIQGGAQPTVFELRSCERLLSDRARARLRSAYPAMTLFRARPAVRTAPTTPRLAPPPSPRGRLAAQSDVVESLRQLESHAGCVLEAVAAHAGLDHELGVILDTQTTVSGLRTQVRRWRAELRQHVREVRRMCQATSDRLGRHRVLIDDSNAINQAEILSLQAQVAEARQRSSATRTRLTR